MHYYLNCSIANCVISSITIIIIVAVGSCIAGPILSSTMNLKELDDITSNINGIHFSYESGFWFSILFYGMCALLVVLSILACVPFVSFSGFVITIPATCGSIAFFILGILVLTIGIEPNFQDFTRSDREAFEKSVCNSFHIIKTNRIDELLYIW